MLPVHCNTRGQLGQVSGCSQFQQSLLGPFVCPHESLANVAFAGAGAGLRTSLAADKLNTKTKQRAATDVQALDAGLRAPQLYASRYVPATFTCDSMRPVLPRPNSVANT